MKTILKKLLTGAAAVMVMAGCRKDESNKLTFTGTYRGSFSEVNTLTNHTNSVVSSGNVEVLFQSGKFSTAMTGNFLTVGEGTFEVQPAQVVFHNQDSFPQNTNFNSSAALHDSYTYQVKGDSLYLTQFYNTSQDTITKVYFYKLKKQ